MSITVRRLSTDDLLIFDSKNYESYIVKTMEKHTAKKDMLALAKELVASGQGIHLTRSHLNHLQQATSHIFLLG